jgi:hypothetical protein
VERIDQREKQEIERDTPLQFKNITMRGGALARLLDQALEVEPQYKSLERFLRKQTYKFGPLREHSKSQIKHGFVEEVMHCFLSESSLVAAVVRQKWVPLLCTG